MADKYGPIFTIRMGINRALVVSNWEIAKECLTTHDKVFANRPKTLAMDILGYKFSMFGFRPYGSYWRETRKIATLELLSNHRLEKLKNVREYELKTCLKELYELWNKNKSTDKLLLVEMKRWFADTTRSVVLRMIVGKGCNSVDSKEWKELLTRFFEMSGKFVVSDALPFLRWLDIGGDERSMKKIARELDIVVQGWLEEHKRKRDSQEVKKEEDFMYIMLSILGDAEQYSGRDVDRINKAICLALILAATDTTTVTLTWVISLLLNHRDILNKAQNELDIQVGTKKQVNESDIKKLVYLQAILKEAMRFGRRMCPGVSFALQIMQLTLASLLHGFDIAIPSNEPLDMEEGLGLTLEKSTPLEVLVAPRLSASLLSSWQELTSEQKHLHVYLFASQAIFKEAMRLYPAAPLSTPHEAIKECTISGYHVLVSTQLLMFGSFNMIRVFGKSLYGPGVHLPSKLCNLHLLLYCMALILQPYQMNYWKWVRD
ncbi:Xanthotoxin 5-hydroxylase CYP82C4 [Citrus sinensis]|uniref:Xanthotoxin 5-hydroxylase CYP82C4 n=1 Tax=Citrus sinensis TaxID=2711 RepID=A0ACB8KFZ8_CITSI|nr:Xanthotoxin 5-hydroxylase CYP82C4 [Citrus sinensis]